MKELLILRHAKSSWKNADLTDHDRPLNKRGKAAAARMGQLLSEMDLVPDIVLSSSAERAIDTAVRVLEASDADSDPPRIHPPLYHGDPHDYRSALAALSDVHDRAMVVGHNPGLEALLDELCDAWEPLPTAALAHVHLPIDSWSQLDEDTVGHLAGLWRPRELQ